MAEAEASSRRAGAVALALLTLVNLLNYLDRYVPAALFESLRRSELKLDDGRLGLLMTSFMLVYMVASPVFAWLADRGGSRPRLLAVGVLIWSAATFLGGLARSFPELFLARAAVGIGEAAYATVAPAMLADHFEEGRRGRAFSTFYAAIPVGSALGYVVGGLVDRTLGWRAAFFVAGVPGAVLALLTWRLGDPPRGARDPAAAAGAPGPGGGTGAYRRLWHNRAYVLLVAGYTAYTFAMGAMGAWLPAFLERVRGLPGAQASVTFGAILVVTGFAGTFAGGFAGDWLLRRTRQAYLWLSGAATLLAVPLSVLVVAAASRGAWLPALVGAQLLMFASTGPVNSALVNAVAPGDRATAVAVSIFAIHALGDVPSPWLVGALSDAAGLEKAVLLMPVAVLAAAAIWLYAARDGGRRAPPPAPRAGP